MTELTAPSVSSHFWLRTSCDPESVATGSVSIGFVIQKSECCLVDWIPVDSRLCAVRLTTSIKMSRECEFSRCLFIVSTYAPTNGSSEAAKGSFYDALRVLLQRAGSSDIFVVSGEMNPQVDRLSTDET